MGSVFNKETLPTKYIIDPPVGTPMSLPPKQKDIPMERLHHFIVLIPMPHSQYHNNEL